MARGSLSQIQEESDSVLKLLKPSKFFHHTWTEPPFIFENPLETDLSLLSSHLIPYPFSVHLFFLATLAFLLLAVQAHA